LGLLLGLVGRGVLPEAARLALGTGLLGSFTTFSTFSVDLDQMLIRGAYGEAALYLSLSVGGGVLAAALGRVLAGQL
ncbi:MAG: CrcB family protein, partial [Deinococcus sp.]|nr:CrcB family protein [Deinococcus sp.]